MDSLIPKDECNREALLSLAETADELVEAFRPGVVHWLCVGSQVVRTHEMLEEDSSGNLHIGLQVKNPDEPGRLVPDFPDLGEHTVMILSWLRNP